jgi:predicted branched-subunit amino acid permease
MGVRQEMPLQLGVAPFGLVFGVLGLASGLTPLQTILLSSIIFGGASQVVFAQLWGAGVPAPIVGASVSVINLRHTLYSASIAPYLRNLPLVWRVPLAYLLTDEAYAVTINRFRSDAPGPFQHYHLLGTGMLLWVCWQITTITGVVFGATIPAEWSLEFAIPLTFIAVVVPILRRRADFIACGTAAVISVIGQPLPWNSWIILAGIGGILAGWLTLYTAAGRSNA